MIVVSRNDITTIMESLTAITMMITLVRTKVILFIVLPMIAIYFLLSLTAITMERMAILGGRMIVF